MLVQSDYIKQLGSGAQSKVFLVKHQGILCAMKKLVDEHENINQYCFCNQVFALKTIKHTNVVRMFGAQPKNYTIFLQYIRGQQLFQFSQVKHRLPIPIVRAFFKSILNALENIHFNKIAHRDIKPQNIMLDEQFNIKVIDFGVSTQNVVTTQKVGTPCYQAPQIHTGKYLGSDADLFAIGIILFSLITSKGPFSQAVQTNQNYKAFKNNKQIFWNYYKQLIPSVTFTPEFISLINKMLSHNPNDRLSIKQILDHPWTKQETATSKQILQYFKKIKQDKQSTNAITNPGKSQKAQQRLIQKKGYRSGSVDLNQALRKINFKPQNMKPIQYQTQINDYVIKYSPYLFIDLLSEFLSNKDENIVIDQDERQEFRLTADKNNLIIHLNYTQFEQQNSLKIILELNLTKDNNLIIRFLRDNANCDIISYQLINVLKDQFQYLRIKT